MGLTKSRSYFGYMLGENHRYAMGSIERLKERACKVGKKWLKEGMISTRKLYVNE